MRRFALAAVTVGALAGTAAANGRAPGTSTIHFQLGHEQNIAAGMTFGLVLSHDGGATWHWMCEDAIGYGGVWDPDYSWTSTGALFATTFNGLKVMRDGCTFDSTPPGNLFVSADELASNGELVFASVDPTDDKVYKSTNDGMTFPTSATPPGAMLNDWYSSLVYQTGSTTNIWLSGYRFVNNQKQLLLYKSTNGGASFTAVSLNGISSTDFSNSSALTIAGIDTIGNVYAVISYPNGSVGGTVWKLAPAAPAWVKIATKADNVSLLVRSNGDLVLGTPTLGAEKSTNQGTTWTPLSNPPHINCLVENSAHEVWACTRNYGDAMNPADGFGIMKTTDLAAWTGVLKYEDIQAPVPCAAGTVQKDTCENLRWCGLKQQLGITSTAIDCSGFVPDGATDAGGSGSGGSGGGGGGGGDKDKGCCETGSGGAAPMVMSLLVAGALLRRRRAKEM
jgi:uncharacterized protein (TIGR03382 family)